MNVNKYAFGHRLVYETDPLTADAIKTLHYTTPMVMQQQRGEMQNTTGALDQGLDFSYFEEDAPVVQPLLKDMQGKIDTISEELIKNPTNIGLANKLYNYKRQYDTLMGPNSPVGQARAKYESAQKQWEDIQKTDEFKTSSQKYKAQAKERFFNERMKSTPDNFVKDFTPGNVVGEIDVAGDAAKFFKDAAYGMNPEDLKAAIPNIEFIQKQAPWGGVYMGAIVRNPGVPGASNAAQIAAGLDERLQEYANPNTRRGTYKQVSGLTDDDIKHTLQQTARMMTGTQGGRPASIDLQGRVYDPSEVKGNVGGPGWGFPKYSNELNLDTPGSIEYTQKKVDNLLSKISTTPGKNIEQESYDATLFSINLDPKYKNLTADEKKELVIKRLEGAKTSIGNDLGDLEQLKMEYSMLNASNKSDENFLKDVKKYLSSREANTRTLTSLDTPDAMAFLETNIGLDNKTALTLIKKGDKKGPEQTSFSKFKDTFPEQSSYNRKQVFFDENLNVFVQDGQNNVYKVNKDFSDINIGIKNELAGIKAFKNDMSISEKEVEEINSTRPRYIPGDSSSVYAIRVSKDKSGKFTKYVQLYVTDESGIPQTQNISIEDFVNVVYPNKAMKIIFTDLSTYNK